MQAFCSELHDEHLRHALVVDLSQDGLRIQRPLGGPRVSAVQLEFEIPEVDELVWARGEIMFDELWRLPPNADGGLSGVIRTSGIQVVSTTERHRRMLREYVMDTWRDQYAPIDDTWLMHSSCYRRG